MLAELVGQRTSAESPLRVGGHRIFLFSGRTVAFDSQPAYVCVCGGGGGREASTRVYQPMSTV